jgi:MFS family permease
MDQLGAVSGPLLMAGIIAYHAGKDGYREAFSILAIPAGLCLIVLVAGRIIFPRPLEFEKKGVRLTARNWSGVFWIYMAAVGLVAAGYADFALAAFHFKTKAIFDDAHIPLLYAGAMAVDGAAALVFGRMFDRIGLKTMAIATVISAAFAPLVFLGGMWPAILGMACWGIGMGAQESIMRAAVADMVSQDRRGSAYGLFNAGYGVCWFAGSALMGWLYGISLVYVVVFSIAVQAVAIVLFVAAERKSKFK